VRPQYIKRVRAYCAEADICAMRGQQMVIDILRTQVRWSNQARRWQC